MDAEQIEVQLRLTYGGKPFRKLLEGGMSYAYEVDGNIIRIPKTEYAKRGYKTENAILNYLHDVVDGVELPYVKLIEEPFFHTIHKKIDGRYWNEKEYLSKDIKVRDQLAEDCAVFFAQLHSADLGQIKAELLDVHPIQKNMEQYLAEYFSPKEMDEILAFTNPLYSLEDKVLVHRDFYQDNFLLSDDYRLKGVLDFGNSGRYNYMFDFKALASWEVGMRDLFERIASRYMRITNRIIDMDTIHRIDIHNYISFLVYFTKNKNVKDEKINLVKGLDEHVEHIKEKMKRYV